MYEFHWEAIPQYFPMFLKPALLTLEITAAGVAIGLILGLITSLAKLSKTPIISIPAKIYIFVIRGTPLLLQLMILFYGLTSMVLLDPFPAAAIALGIHNGAYIAEIFRGAIQSIERGQMEAARSLGMTSGQAMRRIILPQALKRAVPPLGNQFIIALKDSSLASVITIRELVLTSRQLASSSLMYMEMFTIAALYYLFYTTVLSLLLDYVEKRLGASDYKD